MFKKHTLKIDKNGVWCTTVKGDLNKTYYTYQTSIKNLYLTETPDISVKSVDVNGNRAMVLDFDKTNQKKLEVCFFCRFKVYEWS